MTQRSLRFRLLVAAVISISAALVIAGFSLVVMFERHVERRIGSELETYLNQITAAVSITGNGRIAFTSDLADPRFNQPLSGLYWQIRDEEQPTLLRSRSLWDNVIGLPEDSLTAGAVHRHLLPGPAGQALIVRERRIFLSNNEERRIRIAVAVNERSLVEARDAFAADMLPYLAVMAAVLLFAAWIQVRSGLAPLDSVRRGVKQIRSGEKRRLERTYPDEVMPLIDEMNGLLETQEKTTENARAWTADLAHGLKTPLMALTADSQRLRNEGNTLIADDLDQLAEIMRRRVDRELVRARLRSGARTGRVRADVCDAINGIVRTLKRTPRGSLLQWSVENPEGAEATILPADLTELLGNILENAVKWANEAVSVSVSTGNTFLIRIEDDGPGVPEDQLNTLGQRGVRLDEQKQGTGLGLAIARDVCEAYQGKLSFHRSSLGGLAVTVQLPGSSDPDSGDPPGISRVNDV